MSKDINELEKQIQDIEDSKNRLLSKHTVPLLRIFIEVLAVELQTETIKAFKENQSNNRQINKTVKVNKLQLKRIKKILNNQISSSRVTSERCEF